MGRLEKEIKVSGLTEAPRPVLASIAWSQHWNGAGGAHPCLCGELQVCLRESCIWGHANGPGDLCRPGAMEAAQERGAGLGLMLPKDQPGPRSAASEEGSGRSADTEKVQGGLPQHRKCELLVG